ncbi:MAG: hypothetical protein ACPG4T_06650, partial [Nannocystaceae bacterium]
GSQTDGDTELDSESEDTSDVFDCTNGVLDEGEACDDGILSENGPCLPNCILNVCGDGFVHEGAEVCDAGTENGAYAGTCNTDCTTDNIPHCGDGILQEEYEACEEGATDSDGVLCNPEQCTWGLSRYVFLTSQAFNGRFDSELVPEQITGLTRADALCQALAGGAALPGNYRAWLSDNNQTPNISNAAERINGNSEQTIYYVMPQGQEAIAHSWSGLLSEGPKTAIIRNESGVKIGAPQRRVWTNTATNGESLGAAACGNWATTAGSGRTGFSKTGPGWTDEEDFFCVSKAHLYCVEDN